MSRVVAIAGASGLVGGRTLAHLLARDDVAKVIAYVRRPLATKHAKLEERPFSFDGGATLEVPKDIDDAYCALGTTMKIAGSREAFIAVDKTAVLAFAKACREKGCRRFMVVSALGADPRAMVFYNRVKGETEDELRALAFDATHVMRPSFLDGARAESRPGERISVAVTKLFAGVLGKYAAIDVDVVARAMVKLAFSDRFGFCVHESNDIVRIASV